MRIVLLALLFGVVFSANAQTKIRLSDLQKATEANQVPITDASGVLRYKLTENTLTSSNGVLTSVVNGVSSTVAIVSKVENTLTTVSANYQLQASDETVFVNASASAVDVLLPTSAILGKKYTIKKVDESENQVTLFGNSKMIDGLAKVANRVPYVGWLVQYDGVGWTIVNYVF
ncbi:MAG: hypothetical protein K2Q03_01940 [Sphingobacteriaceae bacterium]|nr:hypothetical protein [Sphingobacteriaceae bacterium]